eukprot:scaffold283289_cov54-Attheya_sp.AAC.2
MSLLLSRAALRVKRLVKMLMIAASVLTEFAISTHVGGGMNLGFGTSISCWNVSGVTDMSSAFMGLRDFNEPLCWDVSRVTDMRSMFSGDTELSIANAFNQDISSWDVSIVNNMNSMFFYADAFNQDISSWNVSRVTDTRFMFSGDIELTLANAFNQDISSWNVMSVTAMSLMFRNAEAFNQSLCDWAVKTPLLSFVDLMFDKTACPNSSSPDLVDQGGNPNTPHEGPFCYEC